MIFARLNKDEKGSAMTEFVITLPIFIIIFSGMGSLYQVGDTGLRAMATANRMLWEETQRDSLLNVPNAVPLGALIGMEFTSAETFSTAPQAGGIYFDSAFKTGMAAIFVPGLPGPVEISYGIKNIHAKFRDRSPAKLLLDDKLIGGSPLSTLGLATGIRYGTARAKQGGSVTTAFGTYNFKEVRMGVPINTAATHRLAAVLLIENEHNKHRVLRESILTFDYATDFGGEPDWGAPGTPDPPPDGSCYNQIGNHATCKQDAIQAKNDERDACLAAPPAGGCAFTNIDMTAIDLQCESLQPDPECGNAFSAVGP